MNIIYSQKLKKYSVKHGFSTKTYSYSDHIYFPKQKHTNKVVTINELECEADAIVTTDRGSIIGIKTADCVPILLYESRKRIVAAVHAGWRGTATQIVVRTIEKIIALGGKAEYIVASIGPSIGECCYSVSEERTTRFPGDVVFRKQNRLFLNLQKANMAQMKTRGVLQGNIEILPWCTSCDNDTFYSYRKKNKTEFQSNISFIGLH